MRFDLRHRAVRLAFLGALFAGGAPALAAGQTSPVTGATAAHPQKPRVKAAPAPSAIPRSEKTAATTPAPLAAATPAAPPPATGPKTQTRRGRGAF